MEVLLLSRLQFAMTVMFHYIFPPLAIGLSVVIVYLLWMHIRTDDPLYDSAARFWTRIFGLNFAIGVASGIVMEFQFGTNWAAYSRYVGDVFGSALAAEGIFAFFLESGFLAVLVFGWDKVSPRFHLFSAVMVSLGSIFSSIWIVVANSWQQTPAGFELQTRQVGERVFERAEITDFWALVFNPSTVHRLVHVWFGAFIVGGFFVMSISAWYLLRDRHRQFAVRSFVGGLALATIFSIAQVVSGDLQAKNVAEHQPAKLAAMEAHWVSGPAPLWLFGWPDDESEEVRFGIALPGMVSWLLHGDTSAEVAGLRELQADWGNPPLWLTFQSYHLMVAFGFFFLALTLWACWLLWRKKLFEARRTLWVFVFALLPAIAANQLGWISAEVGRQPWVVYPQLVDGEVVGGLRTANALSEVVSAGQVAGSIALFGGLYLLLFVLWIVVLNQKIQHGPEPVAEGPRETRLPDYLEAAASLPGREGSLTGGSGR
jgi:cytochrome d ubiquinol oxidase subunit I